MVWNKIFISFFTCFLPWLFDILKSIQFYFTKSFFYGEIKRHFNLENAVILKICQITVGSLNHLVMPLLLPLPLRMPLPLLPIKHGNTRGSLALLNDCCHRTGGCFQVFLRPPMETLFNDRYFLSGSGSGNAKLFNNPSTNGGIDQLYFF